MCVSDEYVFVFLHLFIYLSYDCQFAYTKILLPCLITTQKLFQNRGINSMICRLLNAVLVSYPTMFDHHMCVIFKKTAKHGRHPFLLCIFMGLHDFIEIALHVLYLTKTEDCLSSIEFCKNMICQFNIMVTCNVCDVSFLQLVVSVIRYFLSVIH